MGIEGDKKECNNEEGVVDGKYVAEGHGSSMEKARVAGYRLRM